MTLLVCFSIRQPCDELAACSGPQRPVGADLVLLSSAVNTAGLVVIFTSLPQRARADGHDGDTYPETVRFHTYLNNIG